MGRPAFDDFTSEQRQVKRERLSIIKAAWGAVICAVLSSCAGILDAGLKPGEFRDISFQTLRGETRTLADYKGEIVFLNFWASWCPVCRHELKLLEALHNHFKERGFTVIAIAIDDRSSAVEKAYEEEGLTFPVGVGPEGGGRFSRLGIVPRTMLLDRAGNSLLFPDPDSGKLVSNVTGPRAWDDSRFLNFLSDVLE